VPALGLFMAFGPAAGASASSAPSAQAASIAIAALKNLAIGQHAPNHLTSPSSLRVKGLSQVQSTNWSGYADTSETFSSVTGSWTEPSASCTSATSLAAFWVGIDGYSSDSVEQDGTLIECYRDTAYDIQVVGETLSAGDTISASVVRSGTRYTLKVTDSTHTANSFSTTQTCSGCANSSAEWIAEAPSGSSGVEPLSDFHSWTLTGATASTTAGSGVISTFPDDEITMTNSSSQVKAQPGALNSSGNGFSVTWDRSS
jgi:hypothetical protein